MVLKDLIKGLDINSIQGDLNINITGIAYDSRKVVEGNLFICISGFIVDGHDYIEEARKKGAIAFIIEKDIKINNATYIVLSDTRLAMAQLANNFYNDPTADLNLIGVTGTNGKTTTTYLVSAIYNAAKRPTGVLGTIAVTMGDTIIETSRTTQESLELQGLFAHMRGMGIRDSIMEVSSHSLELARVEGCHFSIGLFTNISQDHLDFHKTMENYRKAKTKLFYKTSKANIINIDDEAGRMIANEIKKLKTKLYTYAIDREADIMAKNIVITAKGISFDLVTPDYNMKIETKTPGKFSVYNTLGAIAIAYIDGIDKDIIKSALEGVDSVPGRFEVVAIDAPYTVIVDYAHTPDGLENVLNSIKEYVLGNIITVFGCGGDRDVTKRPLMGEIVGHMTDKAIITSDNPRSENPFEIIRQIEIGMKRTSCDYIMIESRYDAIKEAMKMAKVNDVILIAGKGHETYQEIKGIKHDFDDKQVVKEIAKEV